jgi:hypothetical protein
MLRPLLATAALRQSSPRKMIGSGSGYGTKPSTPREIPPFRPRVDSIKRKQDEAFSYAGVASGTCSKTGNDEETRKRMDLATLELGKVTSICDKINGALPELDVSPELKAILSDFNDAVRGLSKTQELLCQDKIEALDPVPDAAPAPLPDQDRELDPEKAKFKEAIKEAESSSLIFNLDLGRVPLMNKETISKKATLALTTMAAKLEEGNNGSIPCEDTIAAIDDVLGIVEGMDFFGRKTKTYNNSRDPRSGLFCTIPIRYRFKDKDDRIAAENVLRDKCGAHCSTPYPTMVRECIRQVVEKAKLDYPNNQVRVTVDTNNLGLRVSVREKKEDRVWDVFSHLVPLPKIALNVDIRKVPQDFKMEYLPPGKDKGTKGSPVKVDNSNNAISNNDEKSSSEAME